MEFAYLALLAVLIVALPFVLRRLLSGKLQEAKKALEARAATLAGRASATPAGAARKSVPVERAPTQAAPLKSAPIKVAPIEIQVKGLIEQGKKIEAIRLVRVTSSLSLEAAKDSVDAIEQHGRPTLGEMGMMSTIRLTQELGKQVRQLVARGEKIEAIRLVRDQTGLDLREAKELVERLG